MPYEKEKNKRINKRKIKKHFGVYAYISQHGSHVSASRYRPTDKVLDTLNRQLEKLKREFGIK